MKLTSPNYPKPFNKLKDCTWKITAPPGYLVTLDFDVIDVSTASHSPLLVGGLMGIYLTKSIG